MIVEELTADAILDRAVFEELMAMEDEFDRAELTDKLLDKAKLLGVRVKFENKLAAIKKIHKQEAAKAKRQSVVQQSGQNWTKFDTIDYEPLFCGNWIADMNGVRTFGLLGECLACYHPIMPVKRLVNIETEKEKVIIAFNKDGYWVERTFDKSVITSANKIQALSDYGVSVTSENAKYLVKYLNDVENNNLEAIKKQMSTSKMGWFNNYKNFMPFSAGEVEFDSESAFRSAYKSISTKGDRAKYVEYLKKIRKSNRKEPMLCVAVSLASVLAQPCGVLPFIFHLFGEAGKGKTIATMLAASIWGDPNEDGYLADPKQTVTASEVYLNFLNNLPFICDDMSKLKKHFTSQRQDDFSEFIYFLCGGTGKKRSNVNLGVNNVTSWRNCSITNGEKPITSEVSNGGELLRVIELKTAPGVIFDDGSGGKNAADLIRANYGFLGREFVEAVQGIGIEEVQRLHANFAKNLTDIDTAKVKEGKQIQPMALIMTADRIFTDYIMHDGVCLDIYDCFKLIRSHDDMSDFERAYEFILSEIATYRKRFTEKDVEPEQRWGYFRDGYALIFTNVFSGIAERGNFNKNMFVEWAVEHGLSIVDKDNKHVRYYKTKRIDNFLCRFVYIALERPGRDSETCDDEPF